MAERILKGAPAARELCAQTAKRAEALRQKGIEPCLAFLRIGEREEDIAYERSAEKRCASVGIRTVCVSLPADISEDGVKTAICRLNEDPSVHAVLLLLPLPERMNTRAVCDTLDPEKDIDGVTSAAMADLYEGRGELFAPCTACACMEMLKYYGIDPSGRRAAVVGRSIVIGRPVSMLLLSANATVTLCHRHTENLAGITRSAELLIAAAGEKYLITPDCLGEGQIILDVGTNWDEESGKLCGDVSPECERLAAAFTPVPGGIGAVTTAVLAAHTVEAAERESAEK